MNDQHKRGQYWARHLRLLVIMLAIWWIVSYGFGILWRESLDSFHIAGFPLGFWFAQQGSIYVFVALIFIYSWLMSRMDQEFEVHED